MSEGASCIHGFPTWKIKAFDVHDIRPWIAFGSVDSPNCIIIWDYVEQCVVAEFETKSPHPPSFVRFFDADTLVWRDHIKSVSENSNWILLLLNTVVVIDYILLRRVSLPLSLLNKKSPDSVEVVGPDLVCVGCHSGALKFWAIPSTEVVLPESILITTPAALHFKPVKFLLALPFQRSSFRLLVSGDHDGRAILWRLRFQTTAEGGKRLVDVTPLGELKPPGAAVHQFMYLPDGKQLVALCAEKMILVWDVSPEAAAALELRATCVITPKSSSSMEDHVPSLPLIMPRVTNNSAAVTEGGKAAQFLALTSPCSSVGSCVAILARNSRELSFLPLRPDAKPTPLLDLHSLSGAIPKKVRVYMIKMHPRQPELLFLGTNSGLVCVRFPRALPAVALNPAWQRWAKPLVTEAGQTSLPSDRVVLRAEARWIRLVVCGSRERGRRRKSGGGVTVSRGISWNRELQVLCEKRLSQVRDDCSSLQLLPSASGRYLLVVDPKSSRVQILRFSVAEVAVSTAGTAAVRTSKRSKKPALDFDEMDDDMMEEEEDSAVMQSLDSPAQLKQLTVSLTQVEHGSVIGQAAVWWGEDKFAVLTPAVVGGEVSTSVGSLKVYTVSDVGVASVELTTDSLDNVGCIYGGNELLCAGVVEEEGAREAKLTDFEGEGGTVLLKLSDTGQITKVTRLSAEQPLCYAQSSSGKWIAVGFEKEVCVYSVAGSKDGVKHHSRAAIESVTSLLWWSDVLFVANSHLVCSLFPTLTTHAPCILQPFILGNCDRMEHAFLHSTDDVSWKISGEQVWPTPSAVPPPPLQLLGSSADAITVGGATETPVTLSLGHPVVKCLLMLVAGAPLRAMLKNLCMVSEPLHDRLLALLCSFGDDSPPLKLVAKALFGPVKGSTTVLSGLSRIARRRICARLLTAARKAAERGATPAEEALALLDRMVNVGGVGGSYRADLDNNELAVPEQGQEQEELALRTAVELVLTLGETAVSKEDVAAWLEEMTRKTKM